MGLKDLKMRSDDALAQIAAQKTVVEARPLRATTAPGATAFMANRKALAERTGETLGLHYAMRWPRQELETVRPLRTSPLYDRLAARGAEFGSRFGWERANYFRQPADAPRPAHGLGRPGWLDWVIDEQRAVRETVALFDQSSFAKLLVQGRDALALLQRLCANEIDVPPGRMVYTPMLNERGGFESDLTVLRLAADRFWLLTGSAQATRDADWIGRHVGAQDHVALTDVSTMTSVLTLMGPNAAALLARASPDALPSALGESREIDLGHARVRAARISYVGGPGWELYVPVEMARHVDGVLREAGAGLGLADAGYYALDALRIEAGRRAWGSELGPDETPFEAGLTVGVKLAKPTPFIGRDALRALQGQPLKKKLLSFVLDDAGDYVWGGETILVDGAAVGELSSAGFSRAASRCIALGYVRGAAAAALHAGTPVQIDLWGRAVAARAFDRWSAPKPA